MKKKKAVKAIIIVILCLAVIGAASLFIINGYVKSAVKDRLLTAEEAVKTGDVDCIIVLGCQVKSDGSLSHMLRDRLVTALELYNAGAAPKLLMSGDHGQTEYNEVGAMKKYATENGVPPADVFMDHAGFSTYETMYRARDVFCVTDCCIVTQKFHISRAVYIARKLGLDAVGYISPEITTFRKKTILSWNVREYFARIKAFFDVLFHVKPTYLGDQIPITGDGHETWK